MNAEITGEIKKIIDDETIVNQNNVNIFVKELRDNYPEQTHNVFLNNDELKDKVNDLELGEIYTTFKGLNSNLTYHFFDNGNSKVDDTNIVEQVKNTMNQIVIDKITNQINL